MNRMTTRLVWAWIVVLGTVGSSVAQAALVQYFPFDGSVANAVGGGVVASNSGATFTSSLVAPGIGSTQAASFTGSATQIAVNGLTDIATLQSLFTGNFTISTWAQSSLAGNAPSPNTISYVFDIGSSHNTGFGVGFDRAHGFLAGGGGKIGGYYTNVSLGSASSPAGNANQWYHMAVSRLGSVVSLYVDGVLINSANVPTPNITNQHFTIGSEAKANQRNWTGQIDDLGIFNSALSIGQIAAIHNISTTPGLSLNLGAMAELFDHYALGAGGGVITVGGKEWTYSESPFLASLGAGGIGSSDGAYFMNFSGTSGLMEVVPIPAPEPNTLAMLAAGAALLCSRRRKIRPLAVRD